MHRARRKQVVAKSFKIQWSYFLQAIALTVRHNSVARPPCD